MRKKFILILLFLPLFSKEEIYKIEPGDVLEILVLGEEGLSRTVMVMHNGTISFPLIGEIKVSDLTTVEAGNLISEKLKKYFTHPLISVILKSPTLPHVSVLGEVFRPGAVEYQRGLKITDYIALSGGPKGSANFKKVKIVKFQKGKPVVMIVNVDEILKKGLTEKNLELKSGDWIYVPKRFTINWGMVLTTLNLTISILNLYLIFRKF